MEFKKLLIVIPTRNRADFAINAINSVLEQKDCDFELIVSDNSTEESEVVLLQNYCQALEDKRVNYIRPPKPLPMTEHWNWAMEQGINLPLITHVTFLTDRMMFLENSLSEIQNILTKVKYDVVSFCTDSIKDNKSPVTLWQMKWSGKAYEISSYQLIKYFSDVDIIYHPIPRMLNCVVAVDLLSNIHKKFGNYFSSISPDFNFAFRSLDMLDSICFYDKPLLIQYGVKRSNGMNIVNGKHNKESKDFISNISIKKVNFNTPVDHIWMMPNLIMYEYYKVKNESNSGKFLDMNYEKYFISLVDSVFNYEDLSTRNEMLKSLFLELGKYKVLKYRLKYRLFRYIHAIRLKINTLRNVGNPLIVFTDFDNVKQAIKHANVFPRTTQNSLDITKENLGNCSEIKVVLD